jgi:putative DNA primase/helicase
VSAEAIAKALGGRKAGGAWMACCPAHEDREPSLSITDANGGKVLVRCHAGCQQRDVIAALHSRGLWPINGWQRRRSLHNAHSRLHARPDPEALKRAEVALAIWQVSRPAKGTPAEAYLRSRGFYLSPPPAIRFQPGLKHPSGGVWPAMVALVTRGIDDTPIAIHRTFLARDGKGKAPVDPAKMILGPCRGGAVRLAGPGEVLMVGEGLETCLAAMEATGHCAWAALSTSGLRTLDLPKDARDVIVLADGDEAGEAAARDCAWRWRREGRRVRIARPPQGLDFNDILMGRAPHIDEGAHGTSHQKALISRKACGDT